MPPTSRTGMLNQVRPDRRYVTCLWCKRQVGPFREKQGKAFCEICGKAIFGRPPKEKELPEGQPEGQDKRRMMTPQEWIRKHRSYDP